MGNLRAGSILWVDLSSGKVWTEPTQKYAKFIGGRGINTKIVYDHMKPGTKAYDPENVLVFGTGPMTGTLVPGSSRCEVTSRSPLNELLGMSNLGGYWAAELKFAGFDHLAITGKAEKPVYIYIENGKTEIRDASHLWGRSTYDMAPTLRKELGDPNVQVVSIGKGGENRVRYASILTKVGDGAGRTGMGGVMGSKNLKAGAVRGTGGVQMADPVKFYEAADNAQVKLRGGLSFAELHSERLAVGVVQATKDGFRIMGNNENSEWDAINNLGLVEFIKNYAPTFTGCFGCPLVCMERFSVPGHGNTVISCVAYTESVFKPMFEDMERWFDASRLCQEYGLDNATIFGSIAWAIDMYLKGILTDEDTGGWRFAYGDPDLIVDLVEQIASREGIGDLLADGEVIASRRIGRGSEEHTYHTKGVPHHTTNQRHFPTRALATSVGPRSDILRSDGSWVIYGERKAFTQKEGGAEYTEWAEKLTGTRDAADALGYVGKAQVIAYQEKITAISDMMLHCKWHGGWSAASLPITPEVLAELYSIGTGQKISEDDLWKAAGRLRTLERAFNLREGLAREDDTVPAKYFTQSVPGRFADRVLDKEKFEQMKSDYYAFMGWDRQSGMPTRESLEVVGLAEIADELEKAGKLAVPQTVAV